MTTLETLKKVVDVIILSKGADYKLTLRQLSKILEFAIEEERNELHSDDSDSQAA